MKARDFSARRNVGTLSRKAQSCSLQGSEICPSALDNLNVKYPRGWTNTLKSGPGEKSICASADFPARAALCSSLSRNGIRSEEQIRLLARFRWSLHRKVGIRRNTVPNLVYRGQRLLLSMDRGPRQIKLDTRLFRLQTVARILAAIAWLCLKLVLHIFWFAMQWVELRWEIAMLRLQRRCLRWLLGLN